MEQPTPPKLLDQVRQAIRIKHYSQYGTVKQKMQDFSTREYGIWIPDQGLLGLNRTVLTLFLPHRANLRRLDSAFYTIP